MPPARIIGSELGTHIDAVSWEVALDCPVDLEWAHNSSYIAICNAQVVVTTSRDSAYRGVINGSDMATPGGAPGCCGMLNFSNWLGSHRCVHPKPLN